MKKQTAKNKEIKIQNALHFDVGVAAHDDPQKRNTQRGITLIALIITIIILLILAIVSIRLIINGGILEKAESAVKQYSEAEIQEKIQLAYTDYQMGKLTDDSYTFENALKSAKIAYKSVTGNDADGYIVTVETKDGDKQYTVSSTGVGKVKTLEDYGVKIGDYVNYNEAGEDYIVDTSKGVGRSITYNSTTKKYDLTAGDSYKTENLGWRVLGVNEKGELELISDNPTTDTLYLANEEGYLYGPDELDKMCNKLYGKGEKATGARSLNVDDINKLTNYDPTTYSGYGDIWTYRFPTSGNYMQYKQAKSDGTLVTDWTNITSSSYQKFRKPGETNTLSSSNRDDNGISLENTYYYNNITNNISNNIISDMITKGTGTSNVGQWLASPCVNCDSSNGYFGLRFVGGGNVICDDLFYSNGDSYGSNYRVRPVVSLKSDIQIDKTETNDGSTLEKACIIK